MWKKFLNDNNRINNYKVMFVYTYKSPDVSSDIFLSIMKLVIQKQTLVRKG
jgi:hypothetical protein